ncbi:DUF4279 domain-containing protein [Acaryochloris thomasi]|uniref:DUF4279 domain-containing protein n=1 Tax=Acaryochloris thomasi TaxID=2929456 RepID=UPI000DA64B15|nr:DUF4279 domain-containing protein [Acaryochloris thomasi]
MGAGHNCQQVYLKLRDERYYWVVMVCCDAEVPEIAGGFVSPHVKICAGVYSTDVTTAEISAALSLQPTKTQAKGDPIANGLRRCPKHRWEYKPDVPDCLDFETKLRHLFGDLRTEDVRALPPTCEFFISVAYYEYQGSSGGWHLDSDVLKHLAELGGELDIDLYTSGPELPD